MPVWNPNNEWQGQDAIIIGGGSSLAGFDFEKLEGRNTIGCNDAFRLGHKVVKICLFGDAGYFHRTKWDLEKFQGQVLTCAPALSHLRASWLFTTPRVTKGLHKEGGIGWNYSTGSAAVNVALRLGAVRIYLLGFDMTKIGSKTHWHQFHTSKARDAAYPRFIRGFAYVHSGLHKFPGVSVFNVTDGSSKLPYFNRINFEEFWQRILEPEGVPA